MNKVYQLPIQEIAKEWASVKDYIEQALTQSKCEDYTADDVYKQVVNGVWKLYVVKNDSSYKGAIVVSFNRYPLDTVAYICAIGGNLITEDSLVDDFFRQLKEAGATRVQGAARPSAMRLYRRVGMYEKYSIAEAKL
jgi:hypothetical protein